MELLIGAAVGVLLGLIGIGLTEYVRHRRRRKQILEAFDHHLQNLYDRHRAQQIQREQLAENVERTINRERGNRDQ